MERMTEQLVLSEATKTVNEVVSGLGVLDLTREEQILMLRDIQRVLAQASNIIQIMLDMDEGAPTGVTKH